MATKFTVGEVEDEARLILLDTEEGAYRFEPIEVYRAMHEALVRIRRERPASRYIGGILGDIGYTYVGGAFYDGIPQMTGDGDIADFRKSTVNMEVRWKESVVFYVVYKMYLKDDPDTKNDSLSAKYLEMHNAELGG